jgi:hypothetical protein
MKATLLFVFLCSLCWSGSQWGYYSSATQYIEKRYVKYQIEYSIKNKMHFTHEYFPVSLFPLFCLPKNSVDLKGYDIGYLCDTVSVWRKTGHLKIAMLSFYRTNKQPPSKTYTLYSFYFKPKVETWVEESPPIKVVLGITNKDRGYYGVPGVAGKDQGDYVGITSKDRVFKR